MAFYKSPFKATVVNGRIEGAGRYTFPDGNVYIGDFKDGQFHGHGTIHFKHGGLYDAEWENGVAVQGTYTFKDGLEYEPEDWDYCTDKDRRFFSERVNGFPPGRYTQLTNDANRAPSIPKGTFDIGDGYYSEATGRIHTYDGQPSRQPSDEEREWIVRYVRRS
ncbi:uncharacterized protein BJ171DRAFT_432647 [Polychytrium aggregatum]|uniref:uncharacterized protein n=1 Tax=Polychytrium aggregatum TaxID=110093 RepID=UPI0022FEB5EB|nr:uncharacterized protein BJ171DRAFT_432647 [Polychytrium aggregatum]KAI9192974.1 hypothetical protein BJ171DRAFT_432647 [Polychytrium aggregatum]